MPKARSRSITTESSARSRAIAQATLWATVDAPTPPLAPTTARTRPTAMASDRREQAADRAHHIKGGDRADHVVVDAAAHQFAIGRGILGVADQRPRGCRDRRRWRDRRGRPAMSSLPCGLQDDHVGRRRGAVGLGGGRHAAHVDGETRLAEAAILARRAHGGGGFLGLAKGLHADARRRRDIVVRGRRGLVEMIFGVFVFACADHLSVSLSLALSASG